MRRGAERPAPGLVWAGIVAVAVSGFLLLVRLSPGGPRVGRAIDDVGQLVAAALAAGVCGWRSRRSGSGAARAWFMLSGATGFWAAGETAWSYYELLTHRETPFPSGADVGFLLFDVLAVAGLLLWPSVALLGRARWRTLLDGVLVAVALFILSWVTALGATVKTLPDGRLAYVVSLAYPVSDLVLLTLTVVVVAHARAAARSGLGLLAAGLTLLCIADSGFAYLTAVGHYATGSPVDAGWFGGFLLIAAAGWVSAPLPTSAATLPPEHRDGAVPVVESTVAALLPYLPAGIGLTVAVAGQFSGQPDRVALTAATLVIAALLTRQLLAVLDNRQLLCRVVTAQQELHYQAFHDPLTGLANRALFADRLRHGLELHRRDLRPLSLLYCDLDGFKQINDTLGHDAGDAVLRAVAERLRAVTRTGDTVARMGGDEFAILLEDGADTTESVARILAALTQPAAVGGQPVPLAVSIGIAELGAGEAPVTPEVLLQRADAAMYRAKRSGRGTALPWSDSLLPPRAPAQALEGAAGT